MAQELTKDGPERDGGGIGSGVDVAQRPAKELGLRDIAVVFLKRCDELRREVSPFGLCELFIAEARPVRLVDPGLQEGHDEGRDAPLLLRHRRVLEERVLREQIVHPRHLPHHGGVLGRCLEGLDDLSNVLCLLQEAEPPAECHFPDHVKRVPLEPLSEVADFARVSVQFR